jgi:hypothetical protein
MHISIPIIPMYVIRLFCFFYKRLSSLSLFVWLIIYLYHRHYVTVLCDKAMVRHHWIWSWVFCPYIQVSWHRNIAIYQHLFTITSCICASPACSPITDSYLICRPLMAHTVCFRTLKLHTECLCIVLCLLLLTKCVADKPVSSPSPSLLLNLLSSWPCTSYLILTLVGSVTLLTTEWTSVSASFLKLWTGSGKATCQQPYIRHD